MKKRVLNLLVAANLIFAMFAGCGSDAQPTLADDGTVNISTGSPVATEMPAETVEPTAEPTEEPTPEPTEAPTPEPPMEWLAEHGIEITPQGDFTFTTMVYDINDADLEPCEVKANAIISETTEGVEDGYKEVKFVCIEEVSDAYYDIADHYGIREWRSAFDRYTGTSFEFDSATTYTDLGQSSNKKGFVTIVNGDISYDVSITFDTINEFPKLTKIITVTCPVDYDGVVFQVGYSDTVLRDANQTIDYTARLYTIDELPYYGDRYYYFSYTND